MSANLAEHREARVQRLVLQRLSKRNALDAALCAELITAIQRADADPSVGCILLAAEGPAFCAGMDLDETLSPDVARLEQPHRQLFTIGSALRKPLIAAVQGSTFGGGVGLVANAHIVIAAEGAKFGLTEMRLALWPYAIYPALVRAMGSRRTLELSLTARLFSASEAREYGLVHEITHDVGSLESRASSTAQALSESSPDALERGLRFARDSEGLSAGEAVSLALARRAEAFASPEFHEGVRAFQEKRPPRWQ